MEAKKVKTITRGQDHPREWEGERIFTEDEVIAAVLEIVGSEGWDTTERVLSHDGVLLESYLRKVGSDVGYQYVIKGAHKNALSRTVIIKIDYMSADFAADDLCGAEEIAEYRDGKWVK